MFVYQLPYRILEQPSKIIFFFLGSIHGSIVFEILTNQVIIIMYYGRGQINLEEGQCEDDSDEKRRKRETKVEIGHPFFANRSTSLHCVRAMRVACAHDKYDILNLG